MRKVAQASAFALLLSLLPIIVFSTSAKAALVSSGLELNLDASVAGSYNGTTWLDQSGNGYHATAVNSPTYDASDGSFTLNGTNQYFNLGNVLNETSTFTLEVTFMPNSIAGDPVLVSRQNSNVAGNYFMGITTSKVNYYVESYPWGIRSNSTLTTKTKYVSTMVYDSSKNITPYLNGKLNGTSTNFSGSLSTNSIDVLIGAILTNSSASGFFSGKIYSVRMYNRALTASEVDQNYRVGSNYVLSTASAASGCSYPTRISYAWLLQAGTTSTINRLKIQYAGATTTNAKFFANRMEFYADNSGAMGALLGTLTPETITAAETLAGAYASTRLGQYTGLISVTAGTRFWMKMSANGSSIDACTSGGFITKSSGWGPVLTGSNFYIYNGSYTTFDGVIIFELQISDLNYNPTISSPSAAGLFYKGISKTISVTTDSPGKVRFLLNGKRLAGCIAQPTTGSSPTYSASCTWRPANQGYQNITAQLTTTVQGATAPVSSPLSFFVYRRTTTR